MRCLCCVFGCFLLPAAFADRGAPSVLTEGDAAPAFEGRVCPGDVWRSTDHVGRKMVVVYFYPADLTSGCTRQACEYRDHLQELNDADVHVVGVSGDSISNHELFAKTHSLNFPLLSDEDGKIAQAFGVPVRGGNTIFKSVDGVERKLQRGITASRWTFIIGKDGRILRRSTAVDPAQDCKKVLETVRRLAADAQ